ASRDADLDALRAALHRELHRALEGAAEARALLELLRDALGDELRVELRARDLVDVQRDGLLGELLELALQLVDLHALAPDEHSRPRAVDEDHDLVALALDLDLRDAG